MIKNYLLIAVRNLMRNKLFSLINLLGLALGMALCLFITLWVQDELSFNRGFSDYENIYRVIQVGKGLDGVTKYGNSTTPYALGAILKEENPEITLSGRIRSMGNWLMESDEKKLYESGIGVIDYDLIEVLDINFITGDKHALEEDKSTIFISRSAAQRMFGNENPLDKPLKVNSSHEFIVRGVYEDLPDNTNIYMNYMVSMKILSDEKINGWSWESSCYVKVVPGTDMEFLNRKISDTIIRNNDRNDNTVLLQPFKDIGLYTPLGKPNRINDIYTMILIAFVVLTIACINFMNLSIARSVKRSREVGIRKVVGANQHMIRRQFLGESILMAVLSLILALVTVEILLPFFNNLIGKELDFNLLGEINLITLFALTLLVGLGAGFYPALVLAGFKPVDILKNSLKLKSNNWFRTGLVVLQFTVSIILLIITLTIFKQVDYIRNKDMGFDKDYIVSVDYNNEIHNSYDEFRAELLKNPYILDVTSASSSPFSVNNVNPVRWEGKPNDDRILFNFYLINPGFLEFFDIELVMGRGFSEDLESDKENYILNETAVKMMGLEDPLGKSFVMYEDVGTIVGVVKDFHFQGLREDIGPIMLTPRTWWRSTVFVKLHPDGLKAGRNYLKKVYDQFAPGFPMRSHFLDSEIDDMYRQVYEAGNIIKYFAVIAILISCLGLYGLSAFLIQQKTREIGIRKVMGASVIKIVHLISKNFLRWVMVANIIAIPAGYILANQFLSHFAYRTSIGFFILAIAMFTSLFIALFTTSWQSIKAAVKNPVEALKYE